MPTVSLPTRIVHSNAATQWAIARVLGEHRGLPFILSECYAESQDPVAKCMLMLRLGSILHNVLPRNQDGTITAGAFDLLNGINWNELADEILSQWTRTDVAVFIEEDRLEAEKIAAQLAADEATFDTEMVAAFKAFDSTGLPDECSRAGQQIAEEAYALK